MVHLLKNHTRSGWNWLKLTHTIGPINATPEQSFPARNSIGKVGCYVLLSLAQFDGVATKPDISGRHQQNCDRAAIATAESIA
jgi:hypothetical protein